MKSLISVWHPFILYLIFLAPQAVLLIQHSRRTHSHQAMWTQEHSKSSKDGAAGQSSGGLGTSHWEEKRLLLIREWKASPEAAPDTSMAVLPVSGKF